MIELSIIIVNWNTEDILKNCLNSIYKTTKDISFEVIVVDNGSTDDSVEMVERKFPKVKLVRNYENRGFAAANNQGIRESKGKFILLLNSDTIILGNAIEKTFAFMKQRKDAGAVGCKLLNPDFTLQPSCYNFFSFKNEILQKSIAKNVLPKRWRQNTESLITSWTYNEIREVDYVRGAFLLIKSEVLKKIGLLDESFFMYGEEADLCFRMKKAGWRVYFYPEVHIIHLGGASAKKKTTEILQRTVTNLLFRRKHYTLFTYFIYRLSLLVITGLKYIIFKMLLKKDIETELLMYKLKGISRMSYNVGR